MNDNPDADQTGATTASYAELFRGGRAILSVLVILGAALHALQIMVIAIIMPTVVGDIGGAGHGRTSYVAHGSESDCGTQAERSPDYRHGTGRPYHQGRRPCRDCRRPRRLA